MEIEFSPGQITKHSKPLTIERPSSGFSYKLVSFFTPLHVVEAAREQRFFEEVLAPEEVASVAVEGSIEPKRCPARFGVGREERFEVWSREAESSSRGEG
jgi:hypothetical protein